MKRLDSEINDDSPFGSSLMTPVDEGVELFPGIEARLVGNGMDGNTGSQSDFLIDGELDRTLFDGKKVCCLIQVTICALLELVGRAPQSTLNPALRHLPP